MKRQSKLGGVHTGYIIDMLEVAKSGPYYSELFYGCKMRFKKTFLQLLAWMVNEKLLNFKREDYRTKYTTTEKGRKMLDCLDTLEDA